MRAFKLIATALIFFGLGVCVSQMRTSERDLRTLRLMGRQLPPRLLRSREVSYACIVVAFIAWLVMLVA